MRDACNNRSLRRLLLINFLQRGTTFLVCFRIICSRYFTGKLLLYYRSSIKTSGIYKICRKTNYIYLFIYFGCVGSSFLCEGFLQLWQAGATLQRGARASHCRGLSCCGAQAPDAQVQQLWLTGLAAPRHVGSSQTRVRTRVPCISRQILNHCATREAPNYI